MFCNPPYGRQITDWVRKGYEESKKPGTLVVMLIPARTDTSYFHDYIFHGKADEVRFIRGRLTFTDELVKAGRIPYYNRNYVAPRLSELKDMGVVETCGRRRSTHSTATDAVWRRKEVEHDSP